MAIDPRKRQRKLERKKAKDKAKKKTLAQRHPLDLAVRLQRIAVAPILHCAGTESLWRQGMGSLLISRELANGNVAYAIFLVDMYCLGAKDAVLGIAPRSHYDFKVYSKFMQNGDVVNFQPECLRKVIEGAVDYAQQFGLPPCPDYVVGRMIFGDIDASQCARQFVYGKDGKPFFVAGPYDSPERSKQIMALLASHCGPGGYHYMLHDSAASLMNFLPNAEGDDDDETEDEEVSANAEEN